MFAGEGLRIADTDDSLGGIMAEDEGGEGDRGADRFEAARWQRDDQALDLTLENAGEGIGDGLDMPVGGEGGVGRDNWKARLHEAVKIAPKDGAGDKTKIRRHGVPPVSGGVVPTGASPLPS